MKTAKHRLVLFLAGMMAAAMFSGCEGKKKSEEYTAVKEELSLEDTEDGKVYYLNFKPEADQAWKHLAFLYTEQTGVDVTVTTAASGEYEATLEKEMRKSNPPTLFQCKDQQALKKWKDYCLNLSKTDVYQEMTTDEFNLKDEKGNIYAIGYCYEAFGLITNKVLLKEAGYEVSDITNFDSLKTVAEDITARKDELGFSAFASAGLEKSSSWRFSGHLANMPLYYEFRDDNVTSQPEEIKGTYLENYKAIWDLYVNNAVCDKTTLASVTGDMSEAEFGTGKAVFYQNGTWEYANLTGEEKGYKMNPEDLTMIPIYIGVEGEEKSALACGIENCWAVNSKASIEDINATLDFMKWVVTSEEGTSMMAEQFGPIPFRNAKESENVFYEAANNLIIQGNYNVNWVFNDMPDVESWRAVVVSALVDYIEEDGNWDNVKNAFVNGWGSASGFSQ